MIRKIYFSRMGTKTDFTAGTESEHTQISLQRTTLTSNARQPLTRQARKCRHAFALKPKGVVNISLIGILLFSTLRLSYHYTSQHQLRTKRVCLVTTIWDGSEKNGKHLLEVKHALAVNLKNPYIHKVQVILEGSGKEGCVKLASEMSELTNSREKLICVPHYHSQPSYLDMFKYSQARALKEFIIILANADMVFDDTVRLATRARQDTIYTIATMGFGGVLEGEFKFVQDIKTNASVAMPNRCYTDKTPRSSWDAYIFHPKSIRLQRVRWLDEDTLLEFTMNQLYAENSALQAIFDGSRALRKAYQVCDFVRMWHYHFSSKTYNTTSKWVQHTGLIARDCPSLETCFVSYIT